MGFWAAALPFLKSAGGGALAGGALSALGSVFGKSNNSLANSMGNIQHDLAYRGMQIRVNDLKKAGLHPSLAAGMNPGNVVSVPQPEQSSTAKEMAQMMGQAIAQSAAARQQAKLVEAQIRLTNAEAANLEKMGQQSPGTLLAQTDQATANNPSTVLPPRPNQVPQETAQATDAPKVQYGSPRYIEMAKDFFFKVSQGVPQEVIEQEYGEIASELYGMYKAFKDAGININDRIKLGHHLYDFMHRPARFGRTKTPHLSGGGW